MTTKNKPKPLNTQARSQKAVLAALRAASKHGLSGYAVGGYGECGNPYDVVRRLRLNGYNIVTTHPKGLRAARFVLRGGK